jgi:hypothetical protein
LGITPSSSHSGGSARWPRDREEPCLSAVSARLADADDGINLVPSSLVSSGGVRPGCLSARLLSGSMRRGSPGRRARGSVSGRQDRRDSLTQHARTQSDLPPDR